jgi:predicted RecB family nuclease
MSEQNIVEKLVSMSRTERRRELDKYLRRLRILISSEVRAILMQREKFLEEEKLQKEIDSMEKETKDEVQSL